MYSVNLFYQLILIAFLVTQILTNIDVLFSYPNIRYSLFSILSYLVNPILIFSYLYPVLLLSSYPYLLSAYFALEISASIFYSLFGIHLIFLIHVFWRLFGMQNPSVFVFFFSF